MFANQLYSYAVTVNYATQSSRNLSFFYVSLCRRERRRGEGRGEGEGWRDRAWEATLSFLEICSRFLGIQSFISHYNASFCKNLRSRD